MRTITSLPFLLAALLPHFAVAQQTGGVVTVVAPPSNHTGTGVLRAKSCPVPTYPENSLAQRQAGQGRAKVEVAPDGTFVSSSLDVSSGFAELDSAALAVLPRCTYVPSKVNGRAIRDTLIVEFVWSLEPTPTVSFDSK